MEQKNQESRLEELTRDINIKANTICQEVSIGWGTLISIAVLFVIYEGLNLYFGWHQHHVLIFCIFAGYAIWLLFNSWLICHPYKRMIDAVSDAQHLTQTKRFIRCYQFVRIMSLPVTYFAVTSVFDGAFEWINLKVSLILVAIYLVISCIWPDSLISTDIYKDVEELKEYSREQ